MEVSTEQFLLKEGSANRQSSSMPFHHQSLNADDIIYYDYGEADYDYNHKDFKTAEDALMDSDLIVRSDGSVQKISSLDFSKADIFNISEAWEYNIDLNDTDYTEFPGNASLSTARTVAAVFFSLVFLVGFLGNLLVIYTVWRFPGMRRVTYLFLVNLAVTNLIYLLLGLPTITVSYLKMDWPFGDHFCKIDNYVMSVSMCVSILTIMVTGVDRYLAVVYPVKSRSIRTKTVSVIVICSTWVLSLAVMIPRGLLYSTQPWLHDSSTPSTLCTRVGDSNRLRLDTGLRFGLLYILPLAVLIACHLRIGWTLRTRSRTRSAGTNPNPPRPIVRNRQLRHHGEEGIEEVGRVEERGQEVCLGKGGACASRALFCRPSCTRESQFGPGDDENCSRARLGFQGQGQANASTVTAIKIVFALTAVFALGWFPLHLHYLVTDFGLMDSVFLPKFLNGGTVALLFCFGANALNPILYCVFSSHFRRHFRKAIDQCCCRLFKTNSTQSAVMNISLRTHTASDRNGAKARNIGACGQPLLFGKAKHKVEIMEEGEGLNPEQTSTRRVLVLQPRPASLLCEDMDTIDLSQHVLCKPQAMMPGQCFDGHSSTVDLDKISEQESPSVTRDVHKTLTNTAQLHSDCRQSSNHSSSLELQRYQDISPVSVEKITHIALIPGRENTDPAHFDAHSSSTGLMYEHETLNPSQAACSTHTNAPEAVHVWAWPSQSNIGGQKLSVSRKKQSSKLSSHENLTSDNQRNSDYDRHSGSSEGLDTTSSSSGISTLHSSGSQSRLNLTSDNVTNSNQTHSPIFYRPSYTQIPRSNDDGYDRVCSFSKHLPKLTVHSTFAQSSERIKVLIWDKTFTPKIPQPPQQISTASLLDHKQ